MKLSLCIPTMDRWKFLSINLPKYLTNPYIDEIIITDENGNDAKEIKEVFSDPKIKIYINEKKLGPFFNKRRAVSLAKNKFVCLMDSDNFAPLSYFESFYKFLDGNEPDENTLYSPSFTIPQSNHRGFDFKVFNGHVIDETNYKYYYRINDVVFNLGNYIVPRDLFNKAAPREDEYDMAYKSWAADVIYQNYLLITRADAKLITVPNMSYDHIVHEGSIYTLMVNHTNVNYYYSLYK